MFYEALEKLELLGYDTHTIAVRYDHGLIDTQAFYEEVMQMDEVSE